MKKYIIAAGVILVLIIGFLFFKKEPTKLIYISGADMLKKIENKDSFVAVVIQTGCSHCEAYLPTLDSVLKQRNKFAYAINLTELEKEDQKTSSSVRKLLSTNSTPVTIFYKEGEENTVLNRLIGNISDRTEINKALEKNGF